MTIETIKTAVLNLVNLIVEGRYDEAVQACSSSRLTAAHIAEAIDDYGCTFVRQSADYKDYLEFVAIKGASSAAFWVGAPLWNLEEGRSDLTLELTATDHGAGPSIEMDNPGVM